MCARLFSLSIQRRQRRGNIAILSAFLLAGVLLLAVLAIDLGRIAVAKAEAQRAADAAAIAATWELLEQGRLTKDHEYLETQARATALEYAEENTVARMDNDLDSNTDNSDTDGDVLVGNFYGFGSGDDDDDDDGNGDLLSFDDAATYNAVRVQIRRTDQYLGRIPLFLAPTIGVSLANVSAEATAGFHAGIDGFKVTSNAQKSSLMPFVISEHNWNHYQKHKNQYPDHYSRDDETLSVLNGGDNIPELKLFAQGGGNGNGNGNGGNGGGTGHGSVAPGNWGTVDIGPSSNSTNRLRNQIRNGPSVNDMSHHGGSLELGPSGNFHLEGDTGISAGMASALSDIIGQPKTIMIYRSVGGSGNNAAFEIVGFVGITVVDYNFSGSDKYIQIQPAVVWDETATSTDETDTSFNVYQPPALLQ